MPPPPSTALPRETLPATPAAAPGDPAPGSVTAGGAAGLAGGPVARNRNRPGLGILLMCLVSLIFAVQDVFSRHLGAAYPAAFVIMLRYWFLALVVLAVALRAPSGPAAAFRTRHPFTQIVRGLLLLAEIAAMLVAFVKLGLIETHAVFTAYPLLVVALSGPVLGERVGWRRWLAVAVGFAGILIILQPGMRVFSPWALLPLGAALMFAVYALLTRRVSAEDGALVSFCWTGLVGAIGITMVGIGQMQPVARADWPWLAGLCLTGVAGHFLLIRAYELAEAASLQPFAYTQLVWVSLLGYLLLGERVGANVIIGMAIIVAAGLFTWWRAFRQQRQRQRAGRLSERAPGRRG